VCFNSLKTKQINLKRLFFIKKTFLRLLFFKLIVYSVFCAYNLLKMNNSAHFTYNALVFHGIQLPEEGSIVGYAAIIHNLGLKAPTPISISIISRQHRRYENTRWKVFPKSYLPDDNRQITQIEALYKHLVFALKYEGVNLLVFKKICEYFDAEKLTSLVSFEPTGEYSRRIWFLVEWLTGKELTVKVRLTKKSYVKAIDETLQYAVTGVKSPRHLVINNLPGSVNFCPLIHKTPKLERYIHEDFVATRNQYLQGIRKDILQRASAFLLLKDSRASFSIEGESPKSKRATRWAQAIAQAGIRDLSHLELCRLQDFVIENPRFLEMGYRKKGGFVGEHDRITGEPLPDHISAKWQDLETLMEGLLQTEQLLLSENMDAVLCATLIAFGFVFIHPFEDGNGRIHRYLVHHMLAKKQFTQQGIIFPVSASILDHIDDYRKTLEAYSAPLLDYINWIETKDHNIEVLNHTIDYYRYFDATPQAEFLYDCVWDTIQNIIPNEVDYLTKYDNFKRYLEEVFEMPDRMVALLIRFLEQNNGQLSKRAREKEFSALNEKEVLEIEQQFRVVFKL